MRFIADTGTDENYFGINFVADTGTGVLCSFEGGRIADQSCFGHNFDFIADTDIEKYYVRIISAMNSDTRYFQEISAYF